jgi:hypothetical protein
MSREEIERLDDQGMAAWHATMPRGSRTCSPTSSP